MRTIRFITAIAVAAVLPLAVVVSPAAADEPPVAPLAVTAPAAGAVVTSGKPTFSWALPAGATDSTINISSSAHVGADGRLPVSDKNYVDQLFVQNAAASFKSTFRYQPDTYYWQVSTMVYTPETDVSQEYLSPVSSFVVPTTFTLTKFRVKVINHPANNLPEVDARGMLQCNVPFVKKTSTSISIAVYKGAKRIGYQDRDAGDCSSKVKEFLNFQPQPGSIKKGTKLTIKIVAHFGKAHSETTKLKLTWK